MGGGGASPRPLSLRGAWTFLQQWCPQSCSTLNKGGGERGEEVASPHVLAGEGFHDFRRLVFQVVLSMIEASFTLVVCVLCTYN